MAALEGVTGTAPTPGRGRLGVVVATLRGLSTVAVGAVELKDGAVDLRRACLLASIRALREAALVAAVEAVADVDDALVLVATVAVAVAVAVAAAAVANLACRLASMRALRAAALLTAADVPPVAPVAAAAAGLIVERGEGLPGVFVADLEAPGLVASRSFACCVGVAGCIAPRGAESGRR